MNVYRLQGWALILGVVLSLATMSLHPTHFDRNASPESMAHVLRLLLAVHWLALATIPLLVLGFAGLTTRLGWRPEALAGFIFYAFSAVALMFAAIADGLINAALFPRLVHAVDPAAINETLFYNFQLNQATAKVFVAGASVALICWSAALRRVEGWSRWLAVAGFVIGLITLFALVSGHIQMSAHGFGLIMLCQGIWTVAIGVFLIKQPDARLDLAGDAAAFRD